MIFKITQNIASFSLSPMLNLNFSIFWTDSTYSNTCITYPLPTSTMITVSLSKPQQLRQNFICLGWNLGPTSDANWPKQVDKLPWLYKVNLSLKLAALKDVC